MNTYTKLELKTEEGKNIYYNHEYLDKYKKDLDTFLANETNMKNIEFAKKIMMGEEIKANNNIEGLQDDLESIGNVIGNKTNIDKFIKVRILNLYKGYKYILKNKNINKETLKELYSILSKDLLNKYDRNNMGEYYRTKPVYILKGDRLDIEPYQGLEAKKLEEYMNQFFEYINKNNNLNEINSFVKSQIMHYYFVYIHPYFDVNGRTSRTVAMWYLLNNENYPYIIFNRAISFAKKEYEENIIKSRTRGDVTLFLKYMLIQVLKELEKEYIITNINENSHNTLTKEDKQIIEYFLNIKGNLTAKDITHIYNNYNFKTKPKIIFDEKITPLIDKSILKITGYTKSNIYDDKKNIWLSLNKEKIDIDTKKIKYLKLDKYIK